LGDFVTFVVDVGLSNSKQSIAMGCVRCLSNIAHLVVSRQWNLSSKLLSKLLIGICSVARKAIESGSDDLLIECFSSISDWVHPHHNILSLPGLLLLIYLFIFYK
jgi:hypothetical protein